MRSVLSCRYNMQDVLPGSFQASKVPPLSKLSSEFTPAPVGVCLSEFSGSFLMAGCQKA